MVLWVHMFGQITQNLHMEGMVGFNVSTDLQMEGEGTKWTRTRREVEELTVCDCGILSMCLYP